MTLIMHVFWRMCEFLSLLYHGRQMGGAVVACVVPKRFVVGSSSVVWAESARRSALGSIQCGDSQLGLGLLSSAEYHYVCITMSLRKARFFDPFHETIMCMVYKAQGKVRVN